MRIIKTKDYEQMSTIAADILGAQIISKPESVIGLATGSSPIGLYNNLAKRCTEGRLDFSAVCTVNLDEYVGLSPEHEQSYANFMWTNLFSKINIAPGNTHLPNGIAEDLVSECASYDELIRSLGGIDLQLLGIGHNGHIGFNEPADFFPLGTHMVKLTSSTQKANQRFFNNIADVPTHALTMGIRDIIQARRILVVVSGVDKADAVKRMLTGTVVPDMPASILQLHRDCILVADEAALSAL